MVGLVFFLFTFSIGDNTNRFSGRRKKIFILLSLEKNNGEQCHDSGCKKSPFKVMRITGITQITTNQRSSKRAYIHSHIKNGVCSTTHRHPNLPGMELPAAMHYTADIAEACTGRDILLFAVPSPFVRTTAKKAAPHIPEGQLIVDVAKGVEDKTLMTMSEIIEDELAKAGRKARVVALSGPTHAEEVARDMPTAIVAASADEDAAKTVQKVFTTPTFRVYTNDDRRGTELGGAVKNVIALAVGIALGLGYGDNAKAALITRGNAELSRLGIAMGCKADTFAGLSGMGDLIVTCTSMHSRNLHAGMLIGRGKSVEEAKTEVGQVVEGINALPAACRLAKQYKVEMPIVQAVEAILDGKLEARSALMALMGRSLKRE